MREGTLKSSIAAKVLLAPLAAVALLAIVCDHEVAAMANVYAFFLVFLPWFEYCRWSQGSRKEFPLFSLVAGMFAVMYVIPLYLGSMKLGTFWGARYFGPKSIENAMALALLGVASLWTGMSFEWSRQIRFRTRLEVAESRHSWNYLTIIVAFGTAVSLVPQFMLGEGGRQLLMIAGTTVPTAAFALLFRRFLQGKSERVEKGLLIAYVGVRFLLGMSSGWLGAFISFLIVMLAVYVSERRRFPVSIIVSVALMALFFQPGKNAFRNRYWQEGSQAGIFEKVEYWTTASIRAWDDTLSGRKSTASASDQTVSRLSLLEQTANVLELTPEVVPHQYGKTYGYLVYGFIPRFAWPDKPTFNEANQWYQVSYGLTPKGELSHVSMAIGMLTEGYINLGWFGVIPVMYGLGVLLALVRFVLMNVNSGAVLNAIGLALVPAFMVVEWQMAQYVAALLQSILVTLVILAPCAASVGTESATRSRIAYTRS